MKSLRERQRSLAGTHDLFDNFQRTNDISGSVGLSYDGFAVGLCQVNLCAVSRGI